MRIHRSGLTLVEVLVAIFIMSIGLLAILVLFPLAALNMARALRDDRCAAIAGNADSMAAARGLRNDPNVISSKSITNPPLGVNDPSNPVFVDAYYCLGGMNANLGGVIPRVQPSYIANIAQTDRWFSFLDDLTFDSSGLPTNFLTGAALDRQGYYTWAYMLRRLNVSEANSMQMWVIVYSGRPVMGPIAETTYPAAAVVGSSTVTLTGNVALKKGDWLLDVSSNSAYITGLFYQVVEAVPSGATTTVEVFPQVNLGPYAPKGSTVSRMVVLDSAVAVFDRGTGR